MATVPESVDKYTRHRCLFPYLKSLGLVVQPIYVDGDPDRIDQFVVSAAFPPEVPLVTLDQATELQAAS